MARDADEWSGHIHDMRASEIDGERWLHCTKCSHSVGPKGRKKAKKTKDQGPDLFGGAPRGVAEETT